MDNPELSVKQAVYAHLEQSENDVKSGLVQDADEAFKEVLEEIDKMKV